MRKLVYLIVAILLLGLVTSPSVQAFPEGQGFQQLPPGEAFGRQPEDIWVWRYMWPRPPHPEIYTGTWIVLHFGWGSGSEETLTELLGGLDMEFYFDGKEVKNLLKYFTIKDKRTYWSLSWIYHHPPLKLGEHTWTVSLNGSVPSVNIDGAFTVIER